MMKPARMLVEQGRVHEVDFDGRLVRGSVGDGKRALRTGMLIRGRTDVENLCRCREAQRTGMLCPHALALGLAVARGQRQAEGASGTDSRGGLRGARGAPEGRSTGIGGETARRSRSTATATESRASFEPPTTALTFRLAGRAMASLGRGTLTVRVEPMGDEAGMEADLPFLAWLQSLGEKAVRPQLMLQEPHLAAFFTALQGHPRVYVDEVPLRIEPLPLRLSLGLEARGEEKVAMLIEVSEAVRLVISGEMIWAYLPERGAVLRGPRLDAFAQGDRDAFLELLRRSGGSLERSWPWFFQHAEILEDAFRLDASALSHGKLPRRSPARPRIRFELEGSLNHLEGSLRAAYEVETVVVGRPSSRFPFTRPDTPGRWYERNEAVEREAVDRLLKFGFVGPGRDDRWVIKGEGAILKFFASGLPVLQRLWEVRIGERFSHVTRDIERIAPDIQSTPHPDGGWLDVDIGYSSEEGHRLPRHEIQRLLQVGQSHARLPDGKRVVVDLAACEELNAVLQDMDPEQAYGHYRVETSQEDYLQATLGAFAGREVGEIPQADFPEEALKDLSTILRDYQREGVCWMLARAERGLSGILADEMGLGKTLQSLAVAQALKTMRKTSAGMKGDAFACLIVCPKSLLDNWCLESARFTPDLKVIKIHGSQRGRLWRKADQADLLVTSYGLLVRDLEEFRRRRFAAVFLDEASAIKNSQTRNAKAACALEADYRFALTGTPIENSIRDLWSIMQFVAPGYLGGRKTFRERYELGLAGESGGSPELRDRLRRRLRPFILRRTKQRVAEELPDRIEKVLTCPLSAAQRDVYTSLLRAGREKVLEAKDRGEGAAWMTMLTTLLRLRQICCDLRLLGEAETKNQARPGSGKLDAVRELLEEAEEGQHRVLIFSQFVKMLQILRGELEDRGVSFCYLDGQTQGRQAEVDRFQKGEVPVFLISLKAGGYGLNLTAADTVIHYDPWWNPAVEAQAADRAHRIGQTNVVTAYKLISEDTVEEKILRMQRRKRRVIDAALDDEEPLMQGLSVSELEEVLEL